VTALIFVSGAVLVATAALTLPVGRPALLILGTGAALLGLRLLVEPPVLLAQPAKGRFAIVESRDSAYGAMTVVDHLIPVSGGREAPVARQLRLGRYVQGAIFVHPWQQRGREHWSAVPYTDLFHLARLFTPGLERVLFIGGGVGVGPRSFRRHYPEARIDLVEIDPAVVELAGRLPFHLMTQEFLETVRAHLTPDGVLLANLPSALAGEAGRILRAEYRTFRAVFPAVYVFPRHDRAKQDPGSPAWWRRTRNVFLAATLDEPRTREELVAEAERLWGHLGRSPHRREDTELFDLAFHAGNLLDPETVARELDLGDSRVLTDDYAPGDTLVFAEVE
jgi:hypothetical protein